MTNNKKMGPNQPRPSKSLIDTVVLGYTDVIPRVLDKKEAFPEIIEIDKKIIAPEEFNYVKNLDTTIPIEIELKLKNFIEENFIITTISTGFEHNDKPPEHITCIPEKNEDSIIEDIDTGFGECNKIETECPKPQYKTPLYKENYLGEFKEETEKELARNNLGVYSKTAVEKLVSQIIVNDTSSFITKAEVNEKLANLDFVDSKLNANADYTIPTNLFKL